MDTSVRRRHETRQLGLATVAGVMTCLVLVPSLANAQQIGGAVTDATGGILPGVTVEARSPTIIEQVRTVVTDGAGQYLIVALEPGTYTVTYTLPGFSVFVREGIELTSGFTASIDAQLSVGDIQESVTVSGASPVVDIQNVEQRAVMSREVIDSIPTGKSINSYGLLVPGMVGANTYGSSLTQDAGGLSLQTLGTMAIHGGDFDDQVVTINGMDVSDTTTQGAAKGYFPDTNFEEMSFSYSGSTAEIETGGVSISLIPKEGANTFSGSFFTTFSFPELMADNLDQDLIDRGLINAPALDEAWTIAPSFGGPIIQDRLWFFLTHSSQTANLQAPGVFFAKDATSFVYEPDLSRPSVDEVTAQEQSLNLTFQLTSRDKVKAYWSNSKSDQPHILQGQVLGAVFLAPEASYNQITRTNVYQATWTRPQTNRLLFEAGVSHMPIRARQFEADEAVALPGILDVAPLTGHRNISGLLGYTNSNTPKYVDAYRGSLSYVTGSHNLNVGATFQEQRSASVRDHIGGFQEFTTIRGLPFRATFEAVRAQRDEATTLGIYAREQWTLDRLTVNAGLRWDRVNASYPPQARPTNVWVQDPFSVPGQTVVTWNDIQPRLAVAYDLRGDGRTALKFSANRYGKRDSTSWAQDASPVVSNRRMPRSWFDGATGHPFLRIPPGTLPSCIGPVACIPGDGVVQGDPLNDAPNGEIISPNVTPAFGLPAITNFFDPDWAFGWGNRQANWEFTGGIQQEVMPGVSFDVGYFRRAWINHNLEDNRALGSADFEVVTVNVPTDSRLPGGGGGTLSFFDLRPGPVPVPDVLTTSAGNFGGERETWDGIDITVDARIDNLLLQGGVSTGRRSADYCDLVSLVPESAPAHALDGDSDPIEHCNRSENWLTQVKLLGSYTLPYDIQVAATLQSQPGPERLALRNFSAADTVSNRPHVLFGSAVELNMVEPGSSYGERFNQVDFRLTKIFDLGGARFRAMFDLYNLFNANAVTIEQAGYGNNGEGWLDAINIMPGRLAKFAFQLDF